MGQLLLAVDLAPPLLLLGIPAEMLQPLMQWDALGRRLSAPLLLGLASTAILLGWFVPVLFEAASRNLTIWIIKQMVFLVVGLLLWWPVAGPLQTWRPAYPVQLFYLFVARLPMTMVGIMLSLADKLIYTSRSFALELCAPASLPDQQVGGLVMWMVGGLIMCAAFSVVLFRWFEQRTRRNPGNSNGWSSGWERRTIRSYHDFLKETGTGHILASVSPNMYRFLTS